VRVGLVVDGSADEAGGGTVRLLALVQWWAIAWAAGSARDETAGGLAVETVGERKVGTIRALVLRVLCGLMLMTLFVDDEQLRPEVGTNARPGTIDSRGSGCIDGREARRL
jgi:hypothetical protein